MSRIYDNGIYRDLKPEEMIDISIPKEMQIAQLKQKLSDTDYIACKIAEGVATKEEYAEVIAQRQEWRKEINKLERGAEVL